MRPAVAFDFEETQRVQNFFGIGSQQIARQQIRSVAIECQSGGLFGVKSVPADGIFQNGNILFPGHLNSGYPPQY